MRGEQDDLAGETLLLDHGHDDLLRRGVDAVHRLVEQQDVRLLGERAGDEDALLLAAGELPDLRVGVVQHVDFGERVADDLAVVVAGAAEP